MRVTVTKPQKTKSWNPRDRYFWSIFAGSILYSLIGVFIHALKFGSVEYFVLAVVGYLLWIVVAHFLERWVFGPKK